jgi:Flp pilus assembly CpaF family ATPase
MFGEIRGGEAFDLLQVLKTGHSVTISMVHANSAAHTISRFTTCVLQGWGFRAMVITDSGRS